jgi:hypothetical protein
MAKAKRKKAKKASRRREGVRKRRKREPIITSLPQTVRRSKRRKRGRALPGLAAHGEDGTYPPLQEDFTDGKADFYEVKHGTNLNEDDTWEISFTTRKDRLCRIPTEGFCLLYKASSPNRYYDQAATNDVPNEFTKVAEGFTTPQTKGNPAAFLEPALGPASFIHKIELIINGYPLTIQEQLGHWNYVYQTQNRIFTTQEHYRRKYKRDLVRVSTTKDRTLTLTEIAHKNDRVDGMSKVMIEAMASLQFDGKETTNEKWVRFGCDGVFPFDCQSNILTALTGVWNKNGYLPPSK